MKQLICGFLIKNKTIKNKLINLDENEVNILDLALVGMSNKEIANSISKSESYVKLKFSDIFIKTKLKNKTRLYAFIIESLFKEGTLKDVPKKK